MANYEKFFKTPELCLFNVRQSGEALRYVPDEMMTEELCLTAIQQDACALRFVPNRFKTKELCLIAIKRLGSVLHFVPEELKTYEFCLEALNAIQHSSLAFQYIPERYRTPEICTIAVEKNSWIIKFVPKEFRDENDRILTTQELLEKYTQEELLTSSNPYLRELGKAHV